MSDSDHMSASRLLTGWSNELADNCKSHYYYYYYFFLYYYYYYYYEKVKKNGEANVPSGRPTQNYCATKQN